MALLLLKSWWSLASLAYLPRLLTPRTKNIFARQGARMRLLHSLRIHSSWSVSLLKMVDTTKTRPVLPLLCLLLCRLERRVVAVPTRLPLMGRVRLRQATDCSRPLFLAVPWTETHAALSPSISSGRKGSPEVVFLPFSAGNDVFPVHCPTPGPVAPSNPNCANSGKSSLLSTPSAITMMPSACAMAHRPFRNSWLPSLLLMPRT